MKDRLIDLSWKKALWVAVGITLLGIPLGILVGCGIALIEPNWPYIVYEYGPYDNPYPPCIMIGISNCAMFSTIIGAAFLIAVGLSQMGSKSASQNPLSNYPREDS